MTYAEFVATLFAVIIVILMVTIIVLARELKSQKDKLRNLPQTQGRTNQSPCLDSPRITETFPKKGTNRTTT